MNCICIICHKFIEPTTHHYLFCSSECMAVFCERTRKVMLPQTIYFVQDMGGNIKIGISSNIQQRVAALATGSSSEIKLLATLTGTLDTERELHKKFENLRVRGEWFKPSNELLEYIATLN